MEHIHFCNDLLIKAGFGPHPGLATGTANIHTWPLCC